jgi:hypothetical protein
MWEATWGVLESKIAEKEQALAAERKASAEKEQALAEKELALAAERKANAEKDAEMAKLLERISQLEKKQ